MLWVTFYVISRTLQSFVMEPALHHFLFTLAVLFVLFSSSFQWNKIKSTWKRLTHKHGKGKKREHGSVVLPLNITLWGGVGVQQALRLHGASLAGAFLVWALLCFS